MSLYIVMPTVLGVLVLINIKWYIVNIHRIIGVASLVMVLASIPFAAMLYVGPLIYFIGSVYMLYISYLEIHVADSNK